LTVASIEVEKLRVTEASVELRWVKTHPMDRFDRIEPTALTDASVELRWVKTHPMDPLRPDRTDSADRGKR
jgi:ribonuclease HI